MDPITLIIVGLGILFGGTAATAAGIYIAYLTLGEVMEWFRSQRYMLFNRGAVATKSGSEGHSRHTGISAQRTHVLQHAPYPYIRG